MSKKKKKSTELEKRVEYFTAKVRFYQDALGLRDWELFVGSEDFEDRGRCYPNIQGKICTITVGEEWLESKDTTYPEIDRIAFHEVLEMMLAPMTCEMTRYYADRYVEVMTHDIIQRLTNMIYGSDQLDV